MNVDELLNAERELTNDELEFLEQETLKLARQFEAMVVELSNQVEAKDPEVAALMRRPARKMVRALEDAAAIPFDEPKSIRELRERVQMGDIQGALDSLAEDE